MRRILKIFFNVFFFLIIESTDVYIGWTENKNKSTNTPPSTKTTTALTLVRMITKIAFNRTHEITRVNNVWVKRTFGSKAFFDFFGYICWFKITIIYCLYSVVLRQGTGSRLPSGWYIRLSNICGLNWRMNEWGNRPKWPV